MKFEPVHKLLMQYIAELVAVYNLKYVCVCVCVCVCMYVCMYVGR